MDKQLILARLKKASKGSHHQSPDPRSTDIDGFDSHGESYFGRRVHGNYGFRMWHGLVRSLQEMKNLTDRRLGVWYPRKPIYLDAYNHSTKRWVNILLFCDDVVVFMADHTESHTNPGHMLFFRGDVYWHARVNQARWNKKFAR